MQTLKKLFGVVLTAALAVGFTSCTSEPNTVTAPTIDITYSTGTAEYPSVFRLNKRGVGTTGTVPYLVVKSNMYWILEGAENYDWISVSPTAGSGTTNVYLTLESSDEAADRYADLYFVFKDGTKKKVVIEQEANTTKLTYAKDNFGDGLTKNTLIKLYGFANADGSHSYDGVATSGDFYAYSYAGGESTYVSTDDESVGVYHGADGDEDFSGGANILLSGKDSYFTVRNFNTQTETKFTVTFAAKNSDGKFNPDDLKLYIACKDETASYKVDTPLEYEYEKSDVNRWIAVGGEFEIAANVSTCIFFKFVNSSTDDYRIDDFKVVEGTVSADPQYFKLIEPGSDIVGLPRTWNCASMSTSATEDTPGNQWIANQIIYSSESTDTHIQYILGPNSLDAEHWLNPTTKKFDLNSNPRLFGAYEGDYYIFTIPVEKASANTNVLVDYTWRCSAGGPKYWVLETAQCYDEAYEFKNVTLSGLTNAEKKDFYDNKLIWTTIDADNYAEGSSPRYTSSNSVKQAWSCYYTFAANADGSTDVHVVKTVNFPDAMDKGYYFVRMRCVCNVAASLSVYQANYHTGSTRITKYPTVQFSSIGSIPTEDSFSMQSAFNTIKNYSGALTFSTGKQMGISAGAMSNVEMTNAGGNLFQGETTLTPSGNAAAYYPYLASNTDPATLTLSVAASQDVTKGGAICADAMPFVLTSETRFKKSSTMRGTFTAVGSAVAPKIYGTTGTKVTAMTIEGSNIAGTLTYDVASGTVTSVTGGSNTISSTFTTGFEIPTASVNAELLYGVVLPATYPTLKVTLTSGRYNYSHTYENVGCAVNSVTTLDFNFDTADKTDSGAVEKAGITTAAELLAFAKACDIGTTGSALDAYRNLDGDFALGADIDMTGMDSPLNWTQIKLPEGENFNGQGHRIKNFHIAQPDFALFSYIPFGSTVSNLIFDESCSLTAGNASAESHHWSLMITGSTYTGYTPSGLRGTLDNCTNYATTTVTGSFGGTGYIGPLASYTGTGERRTDSDISMVKNCTNYGTLIFDGLDLRAETFNKFYVQIGAMFGYQYGDIDNCVNRGNIILRNSYSNCLLRVGGVVGYAYLNSAASNCVNYGTITGEDSASFAAMMIGGVFGYCNDAEPYACTNNGTINYNCAVADFPGWEDLAANGAVGVSVGGVLGFVNGSADDTSMKEFYNNGDITVGTNSKTVGSVSDNGDINVGGCVGCFGANAKYIYEDMENYGSVTCTTQEAICKVYVGGVTGRYASNRTGAAAVLYATIRGMSNAGTVKFDGNATDIVAYAGGVAGGYFYGDIQSCANTGTITNVSSNENSKSGAIVGKQVKAFSSASGVGSTVLTFTGNGIGGTVNGVEITAENYADYICGGYETSVAYENNFYYTRN